MNRRIDTRKPWRARITAAVWSAIMVSIGVLTIVALNGHHVDLELAVIVGFAALGTWLLLSALVNTRPSSAHQASVDSASTPDSQSDGTADRDATPTQ